MHTYQSHKQVKAAKIIGTRTYPDHSGTRLLCEDGNLYEVSGNWMTEKRAEVGGYLVIYADGYKSFSPAKAFEEGYTRVHTPALSLDEAKAVVDSKSAPRVTLDGIKAAIDAVDYLRHDVLTICVITMRNGFKVVGKAAPADPRNFDYQVGQRFAYDDAFKQLWPLMGFALCEQLHHLRLMRDLPNKDRLAVMAAAQHDDVPLPENSAAVQLAMSAARAVAQQGGAEAALAANVPADPEKEKATASEASNDEPDQAA